MGDLVSQSDERDNGSRMVMSGLDRTPKSNLPISRADEHPPKSNNDINDSEKTKIVESQEKRREPKKERMSTQEEVHFVEGADGDSADIGSGFNIDNNFGAFNPKDVELSGD